MRNIDTSWETPVYQQEKNYTHGLVGKAETHPCHKPHPWHITVQSGGNPQFSVYGRGVKGLHHKSSAPTFPAAIWRSTYNFPVLGSWQDQHIHYTSENKDSFECVWGNFSWLPPYPFQLTLTIIPSLCLLSGRNWILHLVPYLFQLLLKKLTSNLPASES